MRLIDADKAVEYAVKRVVESMPTVELEEMPKDLRR